MWTLNPDAAEIKEELYESSALFTKDHPHGGYFKLNNFVINPNYKEEVKNVYNSICHSCNTPLLKKSVLNKMPKQLNITEALQW